MPLLLLVSILWAFSFGLIKHLSGSGLDGTFLSATRLGFGFVTVTMLFCMGGAFAMFPGEALRRKWKSPAANVYGFMFSAFALAALGGPYVTKFLMAMGGEKLVFGVLSCAPLVAMALSRTL